MPEMAACHLRPHQKMREIHDTKRVLQEAQMNRLEHFLTRRHEIADRYDEQLADLPLITPHRSAYAYSALHLYPIVLHDVTKRTSVFDLLRSSGIAANVHYIPVHTHPYYRARGFKHGDFPQAEAYYAGAISLPLHPGMTVPDQDRVVAAIVEALR
jgi:dTDP-4-amino-4,6-dideoxygalactose transaminase